MVNFDRLVSMNELTFRQFWFAADIVRKDNNSKSLSLEDARSLYRKYRDALVVKELDNPNAT